MVNIICFAAVVLRLASEPTANLAYLLLAALALTGRPQAIQALVLSWLFSMLNSSVAPDATMANVGRYLVLASAAISVAARRQHNGRHLLSILTAMLAFVLVVHSIILSAHPEVSVLKACAWALVVTTLLSAWHGLTPRERTSTMFRIKVFLTGLLVLSVPLIAVPALGFARNGHGFQGLLDHPQAFGLTTAFLAALVGGQILGARNPRWTDVLVFALCLSMIVMSAARTAGFSLAIGLLASIIFSPVFSGRLWHKMLPGLRTPTPYIVIFAAGLAVAFTGSNVTSSFSGFIFKGSGEDTLTGALDASRGVLVADMLHNIERAPLSGIGFGVASDPDSMVIERDPVFNLPINAPIEKGVMPLAVLEELGVFGASAVAVWLVVLLRRTARTGIAPFFTCVTLLLTNLGEYVFFSVGGMGLLQLILLTGAVSSTTGETEV